MCPNYHIHHKTMKQIIFIITLLTLTSCYSYHNVEIPRGEHYVIFCADSFDIYYNVKALIYFCEEMRDPQSTLYNKKYNPIVPVSILENLDENISFRVTYPSMTKLDSDKSEDERRLDDCAFFNTVDSEYLFYKYRIVLIKNHNNGSVVDDYKILMKKYFVNDDVEIYDKKKKCVVYSFRWEPWWGVANKKKFKVNR